MKKYKGSIKSDPTKGGHKFLKEHKHGHECYNFKADEDGGRMYGYRPPIPCGEPKLERMFEPDRNGTEEGPEELNEVLVVWIARDPNRKKTFVVGWYSDATVYRKARKTKRKLYGETIWYSAETEKKNATLLPVDERTFLCKGYGQSPIWYGSKKFNKKVWGYIQAKQSTGPRQSDSKPTKKTGAGKNGHPRQSDPEMRFKVERAAVDCATEYYESEEGGGYEVVSVENDRKGWDLEATKGNEKLLVEVKGLSRSKLLCELTSNEYEKMRSKKNYILFVVCNACDNPNKSIFRKKGKKWCTEDGRELTIQPKEAAVVSAPSAE